MSRLRAAKNLVYILSASTILSVPNIVWAQSSVAAPTREELQRGLLGEAEKGRGRALTVESVVERSPCPLASPEFSDVKFTLQSVDFSGLGVVNESMLASSYSGYIGQEVPVAIICEIRDRAATTLRSAGYLAAVQVPPQKIEGGNVKFDVLLARMTSVQVRGDAGSSEKLLTQYIDRLANEPVFNIDVAERYLLLARDIPGLDVRLSLRPATSTPGSNPGDVVGEFNVVRTPVYVDAHVQNFGSRQVGRFGGLLRARFNGITGMGDQTTISVFSTSDFDEQQVVQAGHEFRVGGEGLRFGGNFTYAWTKPDLVNNFDIQSETLVAGAYASYPFISKQTQNLFGTVGFEHIDQTTEIFGARTNEDNLSIAYARLDYSAIDTGSISGRNGYTGFEPKWAVAASLELRQGLDILGASKGCGPGFVRCTGQTVIPTRTDGDPTAFVVRGEAEVNYRPTPLLAFTLKPRFQYSPDALFAYEEISGGNYTIGRGYDPGTIIGDSGYGLQTEVSYGSLAPKSPRGSAWQPYVFFDVMAVSNKNTPGDPTEIYSAGGGIRATISRQASLDVMAVVPLKREPLQTRRDSARALMTLTVQLAPWSR
ncbi:ShlB/FhaC/HecB family hemolysin secretion/activation protein [Parasphingorhabdus sp. JC815]|uniref:ShlB/FhaC/HecB family hemolysin secretion/activation protein n=1 Tax=Parasphingorhabdus sp. JC815 TaxID=3232140 RepID=UPI00345AB4CD